MAEADTERLIDRLAADARPVRRQRPPLLRAALWLALAVAVIAVFVAAHGVRPHLLHALGRPDVLIGWIAGVLTGVAATIAAFHLAVPGHSGRWAVLPLPLAALWVSTLGAGCYIDWLRVGPEGLALDASLSCFLFIVLMSVLLGGPLALLLRHAALIRPVLTAATGGLAVATLASAGLELFHHLDARLMVLIWHAGSVTLVIALAASVGRLAHRRAPAVTQRTAPGKAE